MRRALTLALLVSIAGCDGPSATPDAGPGGPDTGTPRDSGGPVDAFVGSDAGDPCSLTTYPTLALERVSGSFNSPLAVVPIPGTTDMAVGEHRGRIQIMHADGSNGGQFLNIGALTGGDTGGEQGFLGLAFHPDYATNGLFYVYYAEVDGDTNTVAVGHRSAADPNVADPTVTTILELTNDLYPNHNGGNLVFGPDGNLYIGTGDGGSGGDPQDHGQATDTWYGKILRIHVGPGIATYESPASNPFAGGGGLPEIYAYGLRNPWRFSFDRLTHALFVGDVGQNEWEEVDVDEDGIGGDNYGWNVCEATHDYGSGDCSGLTGHHPPIYEYPHSGGIFSLGGSASITGGVVYRGSAIPGLSGTYLFAEEVASQIAGFRYCGGTARDVHVFEELDNCSNPAGFGEDLNGEIYLACVGGGVMRLTTP